MNKDSVSWQVRELSVSDLREYDKNPRKLNKKGLSDLKESILKFGVAEPIVVNSDYVICGGHGRKKALESLNVAKVNCYVPSKKLTESEFEELNVRLNKNIAGSWDFDILANDFDVEKLLEWGFSKDDLGLSVVENNNDLVDKSDNFLCKFIVEVSCDDEITQQALYEKLHNDGYDVKLLSL
jgi:hypothetical protein